MEPTLEVLTVGVRGRGRRNRKRPDEAKARVVAETLLPGVTVKDVARRQGLATREPSLQGPRLMASAPSHLIMGGLPTEATLANVLVSKYADHLPLYRQSQIHARAGLDLHRILLTDWVGKAAFHLKPVVDQLAEHLKHSSKLFMDGTTAPVLDPGRGKIKTGYLWALAREDRPRGGEANRSGFAGGSNS